MLEGVLAVPPPKVSAQKMEDSLCWGLHIILSTVKAVLPLSNAGTLWKVECFRVPVEPGVLSTCQLPGRAGFVQTPKNKMCNGHQPASPLHRISLFKFDNQNILQFEILVIWFSLVSSLGMKAWRSLLENLDFWWWGLTRSVESSISKPWPNFTIPPPPRAVLRTQCISENSPAHSRYLYTCFLSVTRAQVKARHEFESAVNKADETGPFASRNYFVPSYNFPSPMEPSPAIFLVI